jgi:hypothetical protein
MTELFYPIDRLSTIQLRELYSTYGKQGWTDAEYYELKPEGIKPPELPEWEILININADNKQNYFVFMLDCEDEQDGVMIGFGLSFHRDFAVYLHLPLELLDELVEKYAPYYSHDGQDDTFFYHGQRFRKPSKNYLNRIS